MTTLPVSRMSSYSYYFCSSYVFGIYGQLGGWVEACFILNVCFFVLVSTHSCQKKLCKLEYFFVLTMIGRYVPFEIASLFEGSFSVYRISVIVILMKAPVADRFVLRKVFRGRFHVI